MIDGSVTPPTTVRDAVRLLELVADAREDYDQKDPEVALSVDMLRIAAQIIKTGEHWGMTPSWKWKSIKETWEEKRQPLLNGDGDVTDGTWREVTGYDLEGIACTVTVPSAASVRSCEQNAAMTIGQSDEWGGHALCAKHLAESGITA